MGELIRLGYVGEGARTPGGSCDEEWAELWRLPVEDPREGELHISHKEEFWFQRKASVLFWVAGERLERS